MSTSPSKPPSGPNSATPSGAIPVIRKKPPVSIFAQKKKPARKPAPTQRTSAPGQMPNGAANHRPPQQMTGAAVTAPQAEEKDYTEFPIYITKDQSMQGLHYHAIKLHARESRAVNPFDEKQFTRPVHLHRRSARDKREAAEQSDAASGVDDKERELMNARRAERQAEREANQALIAPTGGESKRPNRKRPQKNVEDVYYDENDPKQKARAQLRYEEARPWHLEDFDNKNVWVGSYNDTLTNHNVLFEIRGNGFGMVPVEKWYRFTETNKVNVMDTETAEKHMARKVKVPRWMLGTQAANDEERRQAAVVKREQMRAERRGGDDDDVKPELKREEYQMDVDEIDFEYNDEFQDDDEGLMFGDQGEDDAKEIEQKIRQEMRSANLAGTGVKEEDKDWDEEDAKEQKKEKDERKLEKRIRRQLIKKESKKEYDSDSERGEFESSSESEDSEEERERLEEEKKQEEARKANGDKSGASTKGTNTPTGRTEKRDNKPLAMSLKRPGSPDLSELSGNESSRKKAKGVNGRAMSPNAANGRSLSPDSASNLKSSRGYGSGSDTDTSRTGRTKIKLKASPPASPPGGNSKPTSRSGSPNRKAFPTIEEVRAAIPAEGVGISELVKIFKQRVADRTGDFIGLVKKAGIQDSVTKRILPRADEGGA